MVLLKNRKGFTAMELIIVIMTLSILVVALVIKNPFGIQEYSSIAADQLIADIQFAQMRAMGLRSTQAVTFFVDATDYGKYSVAGVTKKLPKDITVAYTSFAGPLTFNSLGEPMSAGTIRLSGGNEINILAYTGKAE